MLCYEHVVDASGCFVLPGVIDDHVHFREPGLTRKADIESESKAAAYGGVTSYLEMPNTVPQTTDLQVWADKRQLGAEKSHVNYSFFYGATNDNVESFCGLDRHHVPGIKLFMGSSTGNMLVDKYESLVSVFKKAKELGLPVMTHCEDTDIINRNMAEAKAKYGDDPAVEHHPEIRSEEACYQSTALAVKLAKEVINDRPDYKFELGKGIVLREGKDLTIIANGLCVAPALEAAEKLAADGIDAKVINIHTIKPLDEELVVAAAKETGKVVTVEEHSIIGGLGGAVCECLAEKAPVPVKRIGINDVFGESGPAVALLEKYGLDAEGIYKQIKEFV